MKTSQNGINLIKGFEGLRLHAYKAVPSEKYYTIGYGHYGPDVAANATITERQAEAMLANDLGSYEAAVNNCNWNVSMNQNKFDALVSFCYNLGPGAVRELSRERDDASIVRTMKLYVNAGGRRLQGLVNRREKEANLYNSMVSQSSNSAAQSVNIDELARAVLRGEYGNGDERKRRLGANYAAVQNRVNILMANGSNGSNTSSVNIDELARAVLRGEYGNGEERKRRLGANYAAVQDRVNAMMGNGSNSSNRSSVNIDELARAVLRGEYGNGDERKRRLGANYAAVQNKVNEMMRR